MTLRYDQEFFEIIEPYLADIESGRNLAPYDVGSRRAAFDAEMAATLPLKPDVPGVEVTPHEIKVQGDATIILYEFRKAITDANVGTSPGRAIYHTHGGGMFAGSVLINEKMLRYVAYQTGLPVFSIDYRLAPEHPHPTPVEDCYAGLVWLSTQASKLNVDPARIAIFGESAGGGLAAATTIMARDLNLSPPLVKQILICPMLDDRNLVPEPALEPLVFWNYNDNITGWSALLGKDVPGTDQVSPYAAAARVASVEGLPPLYIDVGQLDIFCEENITYAGRFCAAGIEFEMHVYPGVPHGFEEAAPNIVVARQASSNRLKVLSNF